MPESPTLFQINSQPGIKRDGTELDGQNYQAGQWVRFQRGRPRKIGGYRDISDVLNGPIRSALVDSRGGQNTLHTFSPWGVQQLQFSNTGAGGLVADRTPAAFVTNANYTWTADTMFSGGGSNYVAIIASSTPDLNDIASDTTGGIYAGNVGATAILVKIQDGVGDIVVSGGVVVLNPFLFVYGSNGLIRNSNANDFSTATGWTTGGANYANTANVAGSKIVRGLPMRGGTQAPAGLFWALDELIRVTFVGGTALWRYDTLSAQTSILSKNSVIEYDGIYYWCGVDRFLMYTGVVQEVPNQLNINWFFDNLNFAQRNKVWAIKVPRFGEIWWFYPRGSATECTHAIILNVREGTWYDLACERTAGHEASTFHYPLMAGGEDSQASTVLTYAVVAGVFNIGDTVVGGTSGATGVIRRRAAGILNVINATGTFVNGEGITGSPSGATGTLTADPFSQQLDVAWQQEFGYDKIHGQSVTAIQSYFDTSNIGYPIGGPVENLPAGYNYQTRVTRMEPDFNQVGDMNFYVVGKSYPNSPEEISAPYVFSTSTEHLDMKEQRRELYVRFESNTQGGSFETGKVLLTIERGDVRG